MKKKISAGFLALVLVLQAFIPSFAYALEEKPKDSKLITKKLESSDSSFITIGKLKGVGFSKDNPTASISAEEVKEKNHKNTDDLDGLEISDEIVPQALRSTKSPYITGQQPADPDKPKYWANVEGKLTTKGLDGGTFDWNKVLGQGAKVKLLFTQTNGNVMTGVTYTLLVDKDGTYTWKGSDGKPTYLPLYDVDGNPYTYNVQIERNYDKNVQLIIQESNGTPKVKFRPVGDKQVATISFLNIEIQQVASTKFVSEWHTDLAETERPQIEGYFEADTDVDNDFNFPKNDTTRTILRSSFVENFVEDEDNGPWSFLSSELEKTPKTVEVKTDTAGLTFEEKNGVKTVTSGDHKFKYEFKYDVINGGKLTMTEVIPVTFDANGGKFENFTAPDTAKSIVKEVDYKEDLTDKAEDPTREGKTFKGWSTTADGKTPATDNDFKSITEKKTFYAIWENNDIKAKELTVSESFKDGTDYVNDFIPSLDTLKGQVKIKDANGDYQKLKDGDSLQILDDSRKPIADDDLKDKLYEKLKEDSSTEISRNLTLKAKVNFADGTSQEIEIPIKVIKNIYEGTSTGGKPSYVPENYVKVTVDPTDKATNSQKTYYYVNPKAEVVIPGKNPTGTGDNVFTKWLIKGTTEEYKLADKPRHMFTAETTIEAQYDKEGKGIIKIVYVYGNKQPIKADYHIDGQDYPDKKEGKLNSAALEEDFPKQGPEFKGYFFTDRDSIKGKYYKNPATDTVTYSYDKIITTDDKSTSNVYYPVVFDANGGKLGEKDKVTVYVRCNGNGDNVADVSFDDVRKEAEKAGLPTKEGVEFIEWQDKAVGGTKVKEDYPITLKDWDNGETFYAHYGKASALISYLDLDGKSIADKFKIDGVEYPTEKEGALDEAIKSDVFTAETAPKFIGYNFNRIELNPANSKYALDNKATIKIYYEKLADIIPDTTPDDDSDKPEGYVTVKFLPGDNGTLSSTTKYYVNPKADPVKTMADITQPTIKANQGFKVADTKWKDANDAALDTATQIAKDLTYTAQYTGLDDIIPDTTPDDDTDKPDGYVTVKFLPGDHGTLGGTTKYYVNPKADSVKTMNDITEPTVTANTGYEVADPKWKDASDVALDKTTEIKTDLTYTAQYKFTKDVVPQGPGEGKPVVPDNYVKVTFKEGDHGIISASQTTIYWVNPDKEVTLTAPAVTANVDYKHVAWTYKVNDQDKTTSGAEATKTVKDTFAKDTDITAKYLKKVLDKEPTEDTENYVKVDFKAETHGKIKDGETSVYWVLKNEIVELKIPAVEAKTNYAFKEWKEPVQTSYDKDTTHNAVFAYTGDNVVPQKPGDEKPDVPADFVQVTFNQGTNGTIANTETITYWVNPKVKVTVTAPKVEANDDYKHVAWTYGTKEETNLQSVTDKFTEKTTITAKYLKKVLEEEPQTDRDAYVEVKFNAESNGKLPEDKIVKSYWVLKDTPVTLTELTVTANPGWKFIKYDPAVKTSYSEDTEHKAQYKKIIVTEDPKDKDYVKVTFDPAAQGTIKTGSNAEVWVLKDETIDPTAITPQLEVKTGYAFKEWTPAVKDKYNEDIKHVASYTYNGDDVVPQKPGEDKPNVPNNFVKVTFVAGKHGSIANTETYIYWVNPEKEVTLNAPKVTANSDYKHMAWTYKLTSSATVDKEVKKLESVTDKFTEKETTITAKYLKKVVTENPNDTENYVKVTFKADADDQSPARGTLTGTTTYWVLKNTDVKFDAPKVTPNSGYTFTEWSPAVKTNYDTDTTHTAQYKLKDKVVTENPNDPDYIKVTFNANGGKIGAENTKDLWVLKDIATFADAKAKVATPIKEKATFKEWQDKVSEGSAVEGTKVLSTDEETFYAAYTGYDKIIEDPTTPTPKPGYVRLTFDATGDGKIGKNQEKYIDVLEGTKYNDTDLQAVVNKIAPTYKNNTKVFDKWDPEFPNTTDDVATSRYTATYVNKDKIIDKDPINPGEIDENYIRFVFDANTKENAKGKIGTAQKVIFDVLKGTRFSDSDLQDKINKIVPVADNVKLKFNVWDPIVLKDNTLVENATAENGMSADGKTITYNATYANKDKIIDVTPGTETEDPKPDYVRFIFNAVGKDDKNADVSGKVKGNKVYAFDVLKGTAFNDTDLQDKVKDLKAIADVNNYKFVKWDPEVKNDATLVEAGEGGTEVTKHEYKAVYAKLPKIIEDPKTETPDPEYVRLTFEATSDGRIGDANGKQTKVIDVLKGTPYTDDELKSKLDEIKAVPVKADPNDAQKKVEDTDKTFDKWTPAVPTTGYVKTETFTASYKKFIPEQEKIDITATKTWQDAEGNTPNFTTPEVKFELWRKAGQAGTEEIVKQATALNTENKVKFSEVDKYDANGVGYIYFVKEVFTNQAEKDNWTVSGEGTLNLTNKLKGDSTDPGTDKVGTLTITKKLENEPVALKALSMMRAPAPTASEQLKFKFKVTGPYGYVSEEFELAANESKTLENLAYGKYTVVETDAKGYTPEKANYEIILSKDAKDGAITVINKNIIPDPNKPGETNDNIIDVTVTKVWNGGEKPATEIELWRTGYGLNGKVFQEKVDIFTTTANGENTQTHKFDKLAKQDPSGKEFTYYAVEGNVPANYTASYSEDNLTVTNTYKTPAKEYKVTYEAGSSTATGTMNPVTVAENTDYTVLANGFTNDGYTFKGWKLDNGTIVQPGDTITVTANVTLTAQWEKTTTPPTPDPDKPNPDKPNPWNPDYPKPWNPNYPDLPYIPRYPEIRYETIVQEKIVKVPVPIADNAYVKEVRYMQGFMGDFRPKDGLTRAEAAQILANALVEDGYKYNANFKLPYKDIGEAWYTRAVKIVTEAKVFAGYDDGNFKPQDKITRNEWIATLKRFQELGDVSGNHMKLKDGHWAMAEIEAAYKEGWLKIYSDGLATYEGDKFIPREEVAAVSNKAFNRVLDKTYIINNDKNLITYKDVKKDMWSYEDILCASNTFLYKKDLYRAHWIKEDNKLFNINTDGFEIVKAKFQRNPR